MVLFTINRFMKYERIVLLLGYPWAIFVPNLGGWVNDLEVNFFLWTGGFFDKIAIFASVCKL